MSQGVGYESVPAQPPRGALAIIFFIVFMDLLGFGIIIPLLAFYVPDFQHNAMKVTALFSVYSICQFIGAPILGLISDRFGRRPVLALSQAGSAIGYLLLGWRRCRSTLPGRVSGSFTCRGSSTGSRAGTSRPRKPMSVT